MPARLTRIAAATIAATLVGCIVAPRGTDAPVLGSVPASGPGDRGSVAFGSGVADQARVAYVTFAIGSPRSTQTIPSTTKAMGIAIRSLSGTNLIRSAKCGSDAFCYKTSIGQAVFAYTPGATVNVTVEILLTDLPKTSVKAYAYAYLAEAFAVDSATTVIADGTSAAFDLEPGKTASSSVELAPTSANVNKPTLIDFYPAMGGADLPILITGSSLGAIKGTVKFGATEALDVSWLDGNPGTVSAKVPTDSIALDQKAISIANAGGEASFSAVFTILSSISLSANSVTLNAGNNKQAQLTASGITASSLALSTASVGWSLETQSSGATTSDSTGNCLTNPSAPECAAASGSSPVPFASPTPDLSKVYLIFKNRAGTDQQAPFTSGDFLDKMTVKGVATGTYTIKINSGRLNATAAIVVQ